MSPKVSPKVSEDVSPKVVENEAQKGLFITPAVGVTGVNKRLI